MEGVKRVMPPRLYKGGTRGKRDAMSLKLWSGGLMPFVG